MVVVELVVILARGLLSSLGMASSFDTCEAANDSRVRLCQSACFSERAALYKAYLSIPILGRPSYTAAVAVKRH